MPSVISLKDLRESSSLKERIQQLEDEKQALQQQLELQKKLEAKLREDILDQKKDFEHLEKQFDHFAGLEADYEALQTEIQLERLESMVSKEKEEAKYKAQVKKARDELREAQEELKELKKLDPQRLKRQVVDLKKKASTQASENKTLNGVLLGVRKELREASQEKERLEAELGAARAGEDQFWASKDGRWRLYESQLRLSGEDAEADLPPRVRCLDLETGLGTVSLALDEDGKLQWSGNLEIPGEVSEAAADHLQQVGEGNKTDKKKAGKKAAKK